MDAAVAGKGAALGKRLAATFNVALERLLPLVNALVSRQVPGLRESLCAAFKVAFERTLACNEHPMNKKRIRLCKSYHDLMLNKMFLPRLPEHQAKQAGETAG